MVLAALVGDLVDVPGLVDVFGTNVEAEGFGVTGVFKSV